MMDLNSLVNDKLIFLDQEAADNLAAIDCLGKEMVNAGYIKPDYTQAVAPREAAFPTGLALQKMGVAIPHASPKGDVLKDGIAVLRLRKPIIFHSMEDADDLVTVRMVFMLALQTSDDHITMLQKLFGIFQQEELVQELLQATDAKTFQDLMVKHLH